MSYPVDPIGSPFRRDMDSRTSYGRSSATLASGFRSQSWSRTSPASAMTPSFKRSVNTPIARTYGSTVMSYADGVDYGQSVTLNGDYKRSNEKEQLQGLNDRFAGFIDKVHYLEQQNQQIEAEIQALRQKQVSQSQLGNHYDQELQELRSVLEQIHNEKAQIQLDTDHVEEDIQRMQDCLDEEARIREETEAIIRALKKDMNNSELMKSDLEKKVHSLQDEIAFIRNTHEEEVSELLAQVQASHVAVDRKDFQKTDITEALREIRSQLEGHSSQNLQQVEDWFVCRYSKLTEAAEQNKDAIKSARDEIADYRRQLQSKTVELESVRGKRESLERQLNDIEDRHNSDLESLQETIHQLNNELKGTKWEMARHLREYQDLLNVKMALDIEIAAYRKLLEGEESYFSPSPYRQTPTSRKFTPEPARLKVQHKFVDEIIEEIKVEDDTSDLDESLAEVAQELSAKLGDGQQDEEEGAGEEGEDGGEEGEVVAPDDKEEEGGDETGEGESKKEGEGEKEEEEKDGEEGDDGQGEEDDTQKEEVVEETTLSAKAPESKASPEEKKTREGSRTPEEAREEEGGKEEGGDDAGSDKESKDGDAKDEGKEKTGKDAKVEREKDDKKKTPVTKEEDPKSDPPKPESPESDSPKASSPKAQTPKEAEGKADKKGDATEDKKDDKNDEAKEETDGKDAIVNGMDTSPVKDEPDQKVAITKTVKTFATSEDGAKQVTVTETVKEAEEALQEKLVTSKQTEKQTIQVSKTVTHTE